MSEPIKVRITGIFEGDPDPDDPSGLTEDSFVELMDLLEGLDDVVIRKGVS